MKKKFKQVIILLSFYFPFLLLSCSQYLEPDEIANLLAGKSIQQESKLFSLTKQKYYKQYKQSIQTNWQQYKKNTIIPKIVWARKFIPKQSIKTVFYPLGGPDITHPLLLFPDANYYILCGLEIPGSFMSFDKIKQKLFKSELFLLQETMEFRFKKTYFRTLDLIDSLTGSELHNAAHILLLQLALLDYSIISFQKVYINAKGIIKKKQLYHSFIKNRLTDGIAISFMNQHKKVKQVYYFKLNLVNHLLKTKHKSFIQVLKNNEPYATTLKAAVYVNHTKYFSTLRDLILKSGLIVQDDSGIPISFLNKKKWHISYFGYYKKPFFQFPQCHQPELVTFMKQKSKGFLPFIYGYGSFTKHSNVMIIRWKSIFK